MPRISREHHVCLKLSLCRTFPVYLVVFPESMGFFNELINEFRRILRFFRAVCWLTLFENHFHVRRGYSDAVNYGISRVAVRYVAGKTLSFALHNKSGAVTKSVL